MFGCKHKWIEKARRFTPPVEGARVKFSSEDLIERLAFGFTTVEQECEHCHKIGATVLLGDQTK